MGRIFINHHFLRYIKKSASQHANHNYPANRNGFKRIIDQDFVSSRS